MKDIQSHTIAGAVTVVLLLLLLLLLFKLTMRAPIQLEDEGIVITFGNADEGGGMPDALPLDQIAQPEQQPAPAAPVQPSNNDLMVQEDEESLALAQQTEEERKRQAEQEELLRKQKEAEAQAEAERIAREKALAEKKAKEQEAIDRALKATAGFGNTKSAEGANGEDMSNPVASSNGNVDGSGVGETNGIKATVRGREPLRLITPDESFTQEGIVKVQVWVDVKGNVTNAKVVEGVVDRTTQQIAIRAALQSKFSEGDTPQIGNITYIFKFN